MEHVPSSKGRSGSPISRFWWQVMLEDEVQRQRALITSSVYQNLQEEGGGGGNTCARTINLKAKKKYNFVLFFPPSTIQTMLVSQMAQISSHN